MLRSALRAALAAAAMCAAYAAAMYVGAAWPLAWLAVQLFAWWGHVRVSGQTSGAATYPGWPWQPRAWVWAMEDLIVYSAGYLPALATSAAFAVVLAAWRGESWLPAAAAARQRLAQWYQSRLLRRAGARGRVTLVLLGLSSIRQYLDSRGAMYRVEHVRDRGQGGQVVEREVRWPLVFVSWEIMENSEEAFVVRYSATFYRPEPQVLAAWRSLPQDLPQLLGVPPDQITVDPAGAIIWHAIGSPAPTEALPEAPPEPELPEAEVWSQGQADDDGGPLVEGGPPTELLSPPTRGRGRPQEGRTAARAVLAALGRLGVPDAAVDRIQVGPGIVSLTVSPPAGVTAAALARAAGGLAEELGVEGVTHRGRTDGRPGIVVVVPRERRDPVPLRVLLSSELDRLTLPVVLGVSSYGSPLALDLAAAPHLLLAGTTGSGKSVGMTSALVSLLMFLHPAVFRCVLCDPKMVEFAPFSSLPHLLCPILTETADMQAVVPWLVFEMDRRYKLFAESKAKDLNQYNAQLKGSDPLPRIVLVVDELADLLMSGSKEARKEVEGGLVRLAQKARAAGIHLLLATQKPTVEVVPSLLKGNIPTRVAYRTMTQTESMVILDRPGAELLRGQGDLYLLRSDGTVIRGQGAWVSGHEAEAVAEWWAGQVPQGFDAGLLAALGGAPVSAGVRGGAETHGPPGEDDEGDDGW